MLSYIVWIVLEDKLGQTKFRLMYFRNYDYICSMYGRTPSGLNEKNVVLKWFGWNKSNNKTTLRKFKLEKLNEPQGMLYFNNFNKLS